MLLMAVSMGSGARVMAQAVSKMERPTVNKMEADYHSLESRFEMREKNLVKELKAYLKTYPYTTYEDEVRFMIGALETERGQYKQAVKDMEHINVKLLSRKHVEEYLFDAGYAQLMMQDYKRAGAYFKNLNTQKGRYYYAYCLYKQGQYDKALPVLLELENVAAYKKTVPYYLVQIYYSQQQYDEVKTRAEQLLREQPDCENTGELHRMLGEIYYRDGDYQQAIVHLDAYAQAFRAQGIELVRNDLYLLGLAYYQTAQYEQAISSLKQVKNERDSISESAYMTLGHAYRALGQTEQAKLAYQATMAQGLKEEMKEEAMYNYTLCTYSSSTALGESVTAFTDFLAAYPESKHVEAIYELMSDALRKSKNYKAALEALSTINNPNRKMLETMQYLRFQLGTDAFLQNKLTESRQWMTQVLEKTPHLSSLEEARYWRAEASYRLKDYKTAGADVTAFLSSPEARKSPNYKAALYLRGYVAFNDKRYPDAEKVFEQYVQLVDVEDVTFADALNRLGDCAFSTRNFDKAIRYYGQVVGLHASGSDYALFQKGYAQGLQRQYSKKIETLKSLLETSPKSDYADDALYEIARAQLQLDNEREAIEAYNKLLKQYPNSAFARKSSLELAMLYRNQREYSKAIAAYKQTISTYPASEEAYSALSGLEATYIEINKVDEFVQYTAELSKLKMNVSLKEDSLSYAAAERQYQQGNMDAAYATYKKLAERTGSIYRMEACTRVAEISYDKGDYATALLYFQKMASLAGKSQELNTARLGVLRCSYLLGKNETTIEVAGQLIDDMQADEQVKREAHYNRGKAYVDSKKYGQAVVDFNSINDEVRTAEGAEAKYLTAECYYNMGALDNAEQEIMSFAGMNTQQQYWLARALLLLADINLKRGDDFQARQYLLSLQANYKQADDIQQRVSAKLTEMDKMDVKPAQQEDDNE